MDFMSLLNVAIAIYSSAMVITLCFLTWQQNPLVKGLPFKTIAGLLIVVNFYSWIQFSGAEFGVVYACLNLGIFAWLLIFRPQQTEQVSSNNKVLPVNNQVWPAPLTAVRQTLKLVTGTIATGLCSVVACTMLIPLMPGDYATQLISVAFIFLGLWAIAIYWLSVSNMHWLPPVAIIVLTGTTLIIKGLP